MDVLTDPAKNILTRRANQWHISMITPFVKTPMPRPTGASARLQAKHPEN
jgi:hypothetical protein